MALTVLPYVLLVVFLLQQQYIKWGKRRELKTGVLETVVIPASSVVWFEYGKELIIDHKLFDISHFAEGDGKLTATGIFDGDETDLLRKLHTVSYRHKKQAAQSQAFLALLLTGYHQASTSFAFPVALQKLVHSEKPPPVLQSVKLPVSLPPPQPITT